MEVIKGKQETPWKVCLYGVGGIGKTTLAAYAQKPFIINLEDGVDRIDADKSPYITRWHSLTDQDGKKVYGFRDAMAWAIQSDYKTIVVDTADGLEKILSEKILDEDAEHTGERKESLAQFGYGKGFEMLASAWAYCIDMFDACNKAGKNVVLVAHDKIEKYEDPTAENYGRYQLQIHKKSAPIVFNRMDAILFARWETYVKAKIDKDFNNNAKQRAVGTGKRIIHTMDEPGWNAKNRFGLPKSIELGETPEELRKFWELIK